MQFDDEHDVLRDSLQRFFADTSSAAKVRALMETDDGYDQATWFRMATQLGLQGLTIPEAYGGAGGGPIEAAVVLEEMGRVLLCAPYFASAVLATNALLLSGDKDASREILPGLADGSVIASFGLDDPRATADPGRLTCHARRTADGWRVSAADLVVPDGAIASLIVVAAQTPDGPSLFLVGAESEGYSARRMRTLDRTRKLAHVELADVPARLLGASGDAVSVLPRLMDIAAAYLAVEQVGGAQRCLDMTVGYARMRYQFGRPIGSFQAVKHTCVNMLIAVESARSAAYYAIWALADDSPERPMACRIARAVASESYFDVTAYAIQVHGGIGFTWEHDAHLYYRRALSSKLLLGVPDDDWSSVADMLLAQPSGTPVRAKVTS
jgi:alkylation response protein AidB-like acyl-CoA dehydrogenase